VPSDAVFTSRHTRQKPQKGATLSHLVVRFTNNVVVILARGVRQRKLLRSAATHALANSASLVE
jgi:hypothetical protein